MPSVVTTGALAREWGIASWRTARTADSLRIPITRAGSYRVIDVKDVPLLRAELQRKGWLPPESTEVSQ